MTDFKKLRRQNKKNMKCINRKKGESKEVSNYWSLSKGLKNGRDKFHF
jgi:hypothetical protein